MNIVCSLISIYTLILLAAIVLSWFRVPADHPIGGIQRGLRAVTEPLLAPIRRMLPPVSIGGAGLDLSPLLLFLGLNLLQGIIC
ncbi:MAG: YggT family protein [Acidimicrobiia bacterium]|nr:YggT family protein [Acidimicrobiia bacterium]